jgi:hypothetical protein
VEPRIPLILGFFIAFLIFTWATIVPPFQSPDEIAHLYRAQSIINQPWAVSGDIVEISKRFENPLLSAPGLSKLPFRPDLQLYSSEVLAIRDYPWLAHRFSDPEGTVAYQTTAGSYPPIYYLLVFLFAELLIFIFKTLPYESFYLYRYVSCGISLFFWFLVYRRVNPLFKEAAQGILIVAAILLIPTNLFISSTINTDALFVPLSLLLFVEIFRAVAHKQRFSTLICGPIAAALILTKPAAMFVLGAFAISFALLVIIKSYWRSGLIVASLCTFFSAAAYLSFYPLIEYKFLGVGTPIAALDYIKMLWSRSWDLYRQIWGAFGWLDYYLEDQTYGFIAGLLLLNLFGFVFWRSRRNLDFEYASFFSILTLGMTSALMELYLLNNSSIGIMLQGRYLFPSALGLSILFAHRFLFLKLFFILLLLYANYQGLSAAVMRYYVNDYQKLAAAIPFSSSSLKQLRETKYEWGLSYNQGLKWKFSEGHIGLIEFIKAEGDILMVGGWINFSDHHKSPIINIETPVTPLTTSISRIERLDVQRILGPEIGHTGFLVQMKFSSPKKAKIAHKNICFAVNDGVNVKGIAFSTESDSCRSSWRP